MRASRRVQKEPFRQDLTSQPKSSELIQAKLKALILDVIHYLAVVEVLVSDNAAKPTDWTWFKQLRCHEIGRTSAPICLPTRWPFTSGMQQIFCDAHGDGFRFINLVEFFRMTLCYDLSRLHSTY